MEIEYGRVYIGSFGSKREVLEVTPKTVSYLELDGEDPQERTVPYDEFVTWVNWP